MLFVYNVTNQASFDLVVDWLREASDRADKNIVKAVVGNTTDAGENSWQFLSSKALAVAAGLDHANLKRNIFSTKRRKQNVQIGLLQISPSILLHIFDFLHVRIAV